RGGDDRFGSLRVTTGVPGRVRVLHGLRVGGHATEPRADVGVSPSTRWDVDHAASRPRRTGQGRYCGHGAPEAVDLGGAPRTTVPASAGERFPTPACDHGTVTGSERPGRIPTRGQRR